MEIELRAQLGSSGPALLQKVKKMRSFRRVGEFLENDLYLRHATDTSRKLIFRIRRRGTSAELTLKTKTKGHDTAWADVDLSVDRPDDLERLLRSNRYVKVVNIQKHRTMFRHKSFEINIDRITGLGWFIEIEGRGSARQRASVERRIERLLHGLGIEKKSIVRKGYVPLMLEKKK